MGAEKQVRHLSAPFEECSRAKSRSRKKSRVFFFSFFLRSDRQLRVSLTIGDFPICNTGRIEMRCQA